MESIVLRCRALSQGAHEIVPPGELNFKRLPLSPASQLSSTLNVLPLSRGICSLLCNRPVQSLPDLHLFLPLLSSRSSPSFLVLYMPSAYAQSLVPLRCPYPALKTLFEQLLTCGPSYSDFHVFVSDWDLFSPSHPTCLPK